MPKLLTLTGISAEFTADEIECLVRTAAELWTATGDPNDDLSTRQKELAERAHTVQMSEDAGEGARDTPTVGAAFLISPNDLEPFTINEDAFESWTANADQWDHSLPRRCGEAPENDLANLILDAVDNFVLTGDPRLELQVNGDDDAYDSTGFYVLLHNTNAHPRLVGITTDRTELAYPAQESLSLADAARFHLEQVCSKANWLLSYIR